MEDVAASFFRSSAGVMDNERQRFLQGLAALQPLGFAVDFILQSQFTIYSYCRERQHPEGRVWWQVWRDGEMLL